MSNLGHMYPRVLVKPRLERETWDSLSSRSIFAISDSRCSPGWLLWWLWRKSISELAWKSAQILYRKFFEYIQFLDHSKFPPRCFNFRNMFWNSTTARQIFLWTKGNRSIVETLRKTLVLLSTGKSRFFCWHMYLQNSWTIAWTWWNTVSSLSCT